eukprot:m.473329 g.473329  ORF g.473329 m.473329 type:complete len:199 (-) comp34194_c0_seq1:107-703(-)
MIKGAESLDDVSWHDMSWIRAKATVVLTGWRLLRKSEEDKLSARLRDPHCDPSRDPLVRGKLEIAALIAEVFGLGERTVRGYWKDFETGWPDRAEGVFYPDQRGTYERETILDHEDVRLQLKLWMKTKIKSLSVDAGHAFINKDLLPKIDSKIRAEFGVPKDICHDTAWRWMMKAGAAVKPDGKVYYNDQHQNPAVVE